MLILFEITLAIGNFLNGKSVENLFIKYRLVE
jgi:hypothetical protein